MAGEIVDQMGIVWAHDLADETGRPLDEVAAAFWVARQVTAAGDLWADLEALAAESTSGLSATAEAALHEAVAQPVGRLARSYLSGTGRFHPSREATADLGRLAVAGDVGTQAPPDQERWSELKVPEATAEHFLSAARRVERIAAVSLAESAGLGPNRAAAAAVVAARLGRATGLDTLSAAVAAVTEAVPPPGRLRMWQARALLDDLDGWCRRAAVAVLSEGGQGASRRDPAVAVDEWVAAHAEDLRRAAAVAPAGATDDPLASAALALRRLDRTL